MPVADIPSACSRTLTNVVVMARLYFDLQTDGGARPREKTSCVLQSSGQCCSSSALSRF